MLRISTSQAALVCLLALILAVPAAATHESITYDAPPVDLLVPYDPPPVCIGPQASRCVDPDPVQVPYTYDAPPVQVSIPHPEPPPPPPPPPPDGDRIILVDRQWRCLGPVDAAVDETPDGYLALARVTMTMNAPAIDAIRLHTNCTGTVGRIEVETWQADGVKVAWESPHPHDVTVGDGYIRCHGHEDPAIHQDGVQVMGGERIQFHNLDIDCDGQGNSPFFVQDVGSGNPTDILLLDSRIIANGNLDGTPVDQKSTSLRIEESLRSGARNTLICPGRWFWSVYETGAIEAIGSPPGNNRANLEGNSMLSASSPLCQ
jgi:hypothetical protein